MHQTTKYGYIDALRGYAVLLVITAHTGAIFPMLPYPLKKLTFFGVHGVQLFFLMSCVTLMLSWRSDEAKGRANAADFLLRRFFRIAPLYYLGALVYFVIEPPSHGFDLSQLLIAFSFMNAWHPAWTPTVAGNWMVVPGGWSIGVEFTFYLIFPLMVAMVRSMRSALLFVGFAALVGSIGVPLLDHAFAPQYAAAEVNNFLYFSFPHQLPVFALGTVLFFLIQHLRLTPEGRLALVLRRYNLPIALGSVALCVLAVRLPFPERLPFALPLVVPQLYVASLCFMAFVLTLCANPQSLFNNRPIRLLGQVSFSAYLWHFAFVHKLPLLFPAMFDRTVIDWHAILACFALWLAVVPLTFAVSYLSFRYVETPMIALGRWLIEKRHGWTAWLVRNSDLVSRSI